MAISSYDEILQRAETELTVAEQNRLATELAIIAARIGKGGKRRNITELRGLGKEIWDGIDPDEYVAKERDSWDG